MAVVFISEFTDSKLYAGTPLPVSPAPPVAEQTVSITVGSVQSSAFGATTKVIRVHTDAICSIAIGANPTATATTARLAANSTEYFGVLPGHKIAVITNT